MRVGMIGIVLFLLVIGVIIAFIISSRSKGQTSLATDADGTQDSAKADLTQCAEQLKGLKGLLDSGAITQDEFEEKKRELLNL